MDFEITTVNDCLEGPKKLFIDKELHEFPYIGAAMRDSTYDGFDATTFCHARNEAFALMADECYGATYRRRFIQNTLFISDTLEMRFPKNSTRDLGYMQYVNLTLILVNKAVDRSEFPDEQKTGSMGMIEALGGMYDTNGVSRDQGSFRMMETMLIMANTHLGDKKVKFQVTKTPDTLLFSHKAKVADGDQKLQYVLGIKQKKVKGRNETIRRAALS